MYWIALKPSRDEDATAWGWRALSFTPRVAAVDEAILLEAGASERLFGGRRRLLRRLLKETPGLQVAAWADGPSALVALSLLRLKRQGADLPEEVPQDLPLSTLTAASEHLPTLERIGCTFVEAVPIPPWYATYGKGERIKLRYRLAVGGEMVGTASQ